MIRSAFRLIRVSRGGRTYPGSRFAQPAAPLWDEKGQAFAAKVIGTYVIDQPKG